LTHSLFGETQAEGHGPVEAAAPGGELVRLGRHLPEGIWLGTSSWSFPGWRGIVYEDELTEARLARDGLPAYSQHPLLRAVGIDRGYYQALGAGEWARYAHQVPEHFRFVIKAPSMITDAVIRSGDHPRAAAQPNPRFLDAALASDRFVLPALEGLGGRLGVLVLQFAPMPAGVTRDAHALIGRLAEFIAKLPRTHAGAAATYAVELRNPELLTPRLVHALREVGARLCVGIHARMPGAARQAAALRSMDAPAGPGPGGAPVVEPGDGWTLAGPLVVRWNLHAGLRYEQARARYAPFSRLIDADLVTRGSLVHLIRVALRSRQPAYVIVNNKAEGCAPLSCVELARALLDRPAEA
jgi:uncharacterized protein YecE (DUF72 family)